jgi:hypothetical protein
MFTEQLTQALSPQATLPPANYAAATKNILTPAGNGVDMSVFRRVITFFNVGVVGGGNVQAYYQASAQANMNVVVNVATTIPLTFNTSNRLESLEVRADQLPAGTRYVNPVAIINTGPCNLDCEVLGGESSYKPANQYNTANVLDQGVVT